MGKEWDVEVIARPSDGRIVKVTNHDHCVVVNTPGSHLQRQPRVYKSYDKAMARVKELMT